MNYLSKDGAEVESLSDYLAVVSRNAKIGPIKFLFSTSESSYRRSPEIRYGPPVQCAAVEMGNSRETGNLKLRNLQFAPSRTKTSTKKK